MGPGVVRLRDGAWLVHDRAWLPPDAADALLAALRDEVCWESRAIVALGRPVLQPRLVGWAGELPYRYSGQTLEPRPPGPALQALWGQVEASCGRPFNHVVLNRYRDGRDHMALHADNEPELGRCPLIAAISLGCPRPFVLEPKDRRARKARRRLLLEHGSLLVMGGRTQHTWRHAVPRRDTPDERINVTFRWLHGPPGWRGG